MIYRTHNCGEINKKLINKKVILCGWIILIKKFKYIYIIYIKDFYNQIKLILKKKDFIKKIKIKKGYLIRIIGIVKKSKLINLNNKLLEILVKKIFIINKSLNLPITYNKIRNSSKNLYKYRYLLFRDDKFIYILKYKNYLLHKLRNYLYKLNFLEIDTPVISEYLSISGSKIFNILINNNKFELVQSPQIYKQLLMIGGIDKYYQIAKCFRNEDNRKDRSIEFTQLDFEFSFIKTKEIFLFTKKIIKYIFVNIFNKKLKKIKIITYNKVIKKYGTDKPNLYFNIKINKLLYNNKYIFYFFIKKKFIFLDKDILNIINKYKNILKCNNILYIYKKKHFINKLNFLKKNVLKIKKKYKYIFLIFNEKINKNVYLLIGEMITNINNILIKCNKYDIYYPIWIKNFPLFKIKNNKICSYHHPFTSPVNDNIKNNSLSKSYDLVINGLEIASGSIRINKYKMQKKILNLLIKKKYIKKYFNKFLKALKYGTPPHGGIAFGLERILSLLFNKNIKDIIPFPK
ncbi:MAG: amino acid--tRNA ligase-related protein [Candidatus Shikimatogenerans sp. Tduv]|uniref:Amino acid--tRNA ligase-related protein n=1 Tax=Candidatus Shikimatogenerans sp. Tduv TaxID=3158567 RepID=A0AAU7QSU6_9FLAO